MIMDRSVIRHRLASLCLAAAASLPRGGCVAGELAAGPLGSISARRLMPRRA
jgi:hypothetical protein